MMLKSSEHYLFSCDLQIYRLKNQENKIRVCAVIMISEALTLFYGIVDLIN